MDPQYWLNRWDKNEIGFHSQQLNHFLLKHGQMIPSAANIFVPLCGKSLDMAWMLQQGYRVIGNELSQKAAQDFFKEHDLSYKVEKEGSHDCYVNADRTIQIYCGDYFNLSDKIISRAQVVFDRAALYALPADLRAQYVDKMTYALLPGSCILLVIINFSLPDWQGPPFAITDEEIKKLYGANFDISLLDQQEEPAMGRLKSAGGLKQQFASCYWLQRL